MTTQCVLYSNRLPIDIDANGTAQQQAKGGVAGALVNGLPDVPWVGPGSQALANHVRDNDGYGVPEEGTPRQLGVMEIEGEADPSSTYNLFYGAEQGGACNPDLWFDLHGLYQKGSERDPNHYPPPDYGPLEDPWLHSKWQAYEKINSAYAQLAIQYAGDKTVFLGQDYQVMRTPLHIRRLMEARSPKEMFTLEQFLHTPLPPPQQMMLPGAIRSRLLEGLFANDLIGVQRAQDRDNLLEHVTEVLHWPIDNDERVQTPDGRQVAIYHYFIGPDPTRFAEIVSDHEVLNARNELFRKIPRGTQWLWSIVARLDPTKAIAPLLKALRARATTGEHTVMLLSESREKIPEYRDYRRAVETLHGEIVKDAADSGVPSPVTLLPFEENDALMLALYGLTDGYLGCSMEDGHNLTPEEQALAQQGMIDKGKLSFSGSAAVRILSPSEGCTDKIGRWSIVCNPYRQESILDAMNQARALSIDTKMEMQRKTVSAVRKFTVNHWLDQQLRKRRLIGSW